VKKATKINLQATNGPTGMTAQGEKINRINRIAKSLKKQAISCDWRMTAIQRRSEAMVPQSFPQVRWTTRTGLRSASAGPAKTGASA
jgi:hypothetical protein